MELMFKRVIINNRNNIVVVFIITNFSTCAIIIDELDYPSFIIIAHVSTFQFIVILLPRNGDKPLCSHIWLRHGCIDSITNWFVLCPT